jgi:hypothetical protein
VRVEAFAAEADLVARRVRVRWDLVPDGGEDVGAAPALRLRAKRHDFEFPEGDDRFVVYDSAAFPPPGTTLAAEVERVPERDASLVTEEVVESASLAGGDGRSVEAVRRTRRTTRDGAGNLVRRREEIVDVGGGAGLAPGEPRYYELVGAAAGLRAVATPTEGYREPTARRLYDLVPSVYRRHDVVGPPGSDRSGGATLGDIPESAGVGGQLRRFLDPIGLAADQMRSRAEQLRDIHDVATGDARYLPHAAATVGWDLDLGTPIPLQRHEIRFASTLYRLTGTLLGCKIWVKRLTGWDAEIVEFWRNVFFSNDLGSGRSDDRGSRTVDTADAELLAGRGTAGDRLDYTHDGRTSQEARYALRAIGIFVTPPEADLADAARLLAKRDRLLANTALYLPLNLRAVVVLDIPTDSSEGDTVLGVTTSADTP